MKFVLSSFIVKLDLFNFPQYNTVLMICNEVLVIGYYAQGSDLGIGNAKCSLVYGVTFLIQIRRGEVLKLLIKVSIYL